MLADGQPRSLWSAISCSRTSQWTTIKATSSDWQASSVWLQYKMISSLLSSLIYACQLYEIILSHSAV